jgi:8-oxo-dGTP diphosphatase
MMRRMRRYGETWRKGAPYRERHGAYGVILRGRRMLLARTTQPGEEFQLPGGGIDPGESPLRALHREALEETGWTLRPERRLGAFQRYCYMPEYAIWARKVCHIYLCHPGVRTAAPVEPDHWPEWMDMEEAAERLYNTGDRAFVRALIGRMR